MALISALPAPRFDSSSQELRKASTCQDYGLSALTTHTEMWTYLDSRKITALIVSTGHGVFYPSRQHIRHLLVQVLFGTQIMEWRLYRLQHPPYGTIEDSPVLCANH